MKDFCVGLMGFLAACAVGWMLGATWTQAAVPSASTGYDVPYSVTADLPYTASVKDSVGRTITVSGVNHITSSGVNHIEIAEPPPPPEGLVFGQVTDIFGTPVSSATAGKVLILRGSGFPMTNGVPPFSPSSLRLSFAGQSLMVAAWTNDAVQFGIPNTVSDPLTAPLTGKFTVWRQNAGNWVALGTGGAFTITPSRPPTGRRAPAARKR